jgi:hypothetical protein
MCLLGFQHKTILVGEVIPPKTLFWGGGNEGISSLDVESNNFRTASPILVIHSSNDASPQKKFRCNRQTAEICF